MDFGAIPTLVLALQVFLALAPTSPIIQPVGPRLRVAVLMPAHNEAQVIADTLRSIIPQLSDNDRLLVVADNCTDDTAAIAKDFGAEVIERQDETHAKATLWILVCNFWLGIIRPTC